MEQKAKFIIIGLAGALVVFVLLFFQALSSKQVLTREKGDLQKDNQTLNAKLDKLSRELRSRQEEFNGLRQEIDRIGKERDEIQKQYVLVNRERDEALEKLREVQEPQRVALPPPEPPAGQEAYWAQILKEKTDLEMQLASIRSELKSMQLSNEQVQKEKSNLELDLNSIKHDDDEVRRQMDYNQKLMDSLAQELVRERNDKIKIGESLKNIRGENGVLSRQLKSLNNRKVSLEKKIQELEEENDKLRQKYSEVEANLTDKASQIGNLKKQVVDLGQDEPQAEEEGKNSAVELPPIVVRPQLEAAAEKTEASILAPGRVLSINKENNFVIIDIGEQAAVKAGRALHAYRDNKLIAELVVIQTRKDISACDIKKEYDTVRVGDIVK